MSTEAEKRVVVVTAQFDLMQAMLEALLDQPVTPDSALAIVRIMEAQRRLLGISPA